MDTCTFNPNPRQPQPHQFQRLCRRNRPYHKGSQPHKPATASLSRLSRSLTGPNRGPVIPAPIGEREREPPQEYPKTATSPPTKPNPETPKQPKQPEPNTTRTHRTTTFIHQTEIMLHPADHESTLLSASHRHSDRESQSSTMKTHQKYTNKHLERADTDRSAHLVMLASTHQNRHIHTRKAHIPSPDGSVGSIRQSPPQSTSHRSTGG